MTWWGDDGEEWPDPPQPDLYVSDNPVIGVILGPDGDVLVEVRERPDVPFGFQPPR